MWWKTILLMYIMLFLIFLSLSLLIKFKDNGEISKNSWHIKLYKFLWIIKSNYYLPTNICSYFWKYFLAILIFPFNFIGIIIALLWKKVKEDFENLPHVISILAYVYLVLIYLLGPELSACWITPSQTVQELTTFQWIYTLHLGIISTVIIFLITCLILLVVDKHENKPKKKSMLFQRLKDWKNKSCTKITYK